MSIPHTRLAQVVNTWLHPRAGGRDLAFRERVIRSTLGIVIVLALISLALNVLVFRSQIALVSYFSVHVGGIVILLIAAILVTRGHVLSSGWLLVLTFMFGAASLILIARQDGLAVGMANGIPTIMFVPLVATLVLPRTAILLVTSLSIISYLLAGFAIPVSDFEVANISALEWASFAVPALLIEGSLLRQLRIEFDRRLEFLTESIGQVELAKQEAEEARQRAENADRAKTQFLANMSHELRTPLNAVIGYDEVMLGGMVGSFTEKQTEMLRRIRYNGRRLLALINDILDLSKIESGSIEVYQAPISPRKVITETVDGLRSLALERHIDLEIDFHQTLPEIVLGDTSKIQQILVNLVSNAVKFTAEGSVVVSARDAGPTQWQFSVRDTGIGIPDEARALIFEPFKQIDDSERRQVKGTGLGLAISKRLAEMMGGTIAVTSELEQGSTFTVTLPRVTLPDIADPVTDPNEG